MTCLPRSNDGLPLRLTNGQLARDHSCCTSAIRYSRCGDTAQYIYVSASLSMGSKIVYGGKCWTIYDGPFQPAPAGTISDPALIIQDGTSHCCICDDCGDGRAIDGIIVTVTFSGLTLQTHDCTPCAVADDRGYSRLAPGASEVQINGLTLTTSLACGQSVALWTDALPVYASPDGSLEAHWTASVESDGGCSEESLDGVVLTSASRDVKVTLSLDFSGGMSTVIIQAGEYTRVFSATENIDTTGLCDGPMTFEIPNSAQACIGNRWAWGGQATVTIELDGGI